MALLAWDVFDIWISSITGDNSSYKLKEMSTFWKNFALMWCWLLPLFYVVLGAILKDRTIRSCWMERGARGIKAKHKKPETSFTALRGKNSLKWHWEWPRIRWNLISAWWQHNPPHDDPRYLNPPLYSQFPNKTYQVQTYTKTWGRAVNIHWMCIYLQK